MADVSLNAALTECALARLEHGPATVDEIVQCAYRDHGDVFTSEAQRLVWIAARSIAKRVLSDLIDDDDAPQLSLPGINLPSAIAVAQVDGSYMYVRADMATWADLCAGRNVRESNVARAQAKLVRYDETLERLRPWMESDEACTVADALRREAGLFTWLERRHGG